MANPTAQSLVKAIDRQALVVEEVDDQFDQIFAAARGKEFVLLGEASHGTKEFYRARAAITKRLIAELGFDAVAVEADWPDAYVVNRFVSARSATASAEEALEAFERFPTWMWANVEVLNFIEWLAAFNQKSKGSANNRNQSVGFYGLDLYSMATSVHAVINYLDGVDPAAALRARQRYACLDHFMDHPQAYGRAAEFGLTQSCEQEITKQLIELRQKAYDYMKRDGIVAGEEYFCAEQNANLVRSAEIYYRSMFRSGERSWNVRDHHMFRTLVELARHIEGQKNRRARIVVWAHNSHIGDASATEMSQRQEYNIGQLVRQNYGPKALLIGFSTCRGTVTAASDWDSPTQRKVVRTPILDSYEDVFDRVSHEKFYLNLMADNEATTLLRDVRLQRAIGVIYRPETERASHYFHACLPRQFDFMIHFDDTSAVESLGVEAHWHRGELDETYPTGF